MKDSLAIIASIVYWDDLDYNKYFYWDGAQLQKVSKDKIVSIFNNIWGSRIHQLSIQYPEEYAAINKPLEFKMSPEISERVKEVKNIASELQDSSFEDCLKSLQKWVRFAVNQHIEIQLEGVAVLPDVVEPRGKFGLALRPEGGCEGTGQSGSAGEMVVDGLGAGAILADVGKTCGVLHKMTS